MPQTGDSQNNLPPGARRYSPQGAVIGLTLLLMFVCSVGVWAVGYYSGALVIDFCPEPTQDCVLYRRLEQLYGGNHMDRSNTQARVIGSALTVYVVVTAWLIWRPRYIPRLGVERPGIEQSLRDDPYCHVKFCLFIAAAFVFIGLAVFGSDTYTEEWQYERALSNLDRRGGVPGEPQPVLLALAFGFLGGLWVLLNYYAKVWFMVLRDIRAEKRRAQDP